VRLQPANGRPHNEERREDAARRARAKRRGPHRPLRYEEQEERGHRDVAPKQVLDEVVADAERAWVHETSDTDDDTSDRGPPHPVNGELGEEILERVHRQRQERR
jgi:hypothetical protein